VRGAEGLTDREGPVEELAPRRHDLHVRAVSGEFAQGDRRLEPGDASARYEYARLHLSAGVSVHSSE
jgi:hypothetical protein